GFVEVGVVVVVVEVDVEVDVLVEVVVVIVVEYSYAEATLLRLVTPTPAARPRQTSTASAKLTARKTRTRLPSSSLFIRLMRSPRSVVVLDRAGRLRVAEVGVGARVGDLDVERLVRLLELVAVHRDVDRRHARAGREGERTALREVVTGRDRGPVGGHVADRDRAQRRG